ncbi:hypothetical protein SSYM_1287, partial [Serratia symbiotica str. Tucson]
MIKLCSILDFYDRSFRGDCNLN